MIPLSHSKMTYTIERALKTMGSDIEFDSFDELGHWITCDPPLKERRGGAKHSPSLIKNHQK